jgi:hypothetical protein
MALDLAGRVSRVRAKHSPLNQLPKNENETSEDWYIRYLEFLGKDSTRLKDESHEAFMERTFKPTAVKDNLEQVYDYVCEIADLFGQKERCNMSLMLDNPVDEPFEFVIRVLKKCRIPTADLES